MPVYPQLSLKDLFNLTGPKPKSRSKKSKIIALRKRKNLKRFSYVVRSSENYSSPDGHLVSFIYPNLPPFAALQHLPQRTPLNQRAKLHCTCQAYKYWGSHFLATREGYELAKAKEHRPANIRDPAEENYTCKHVISVARSLKGKSFPMLFQDFGLYGAHQATSYVSMVTPILRAALHDDGWYDDDIDDLFATLSEENLEDVLEAQGFLVSGADDADA